MSTNTQITYYTFLDRDGRQIDINSDYIHTHLEWCGNARNLFHILDNGDRDMSKLEYDNERQAYWEDQYTKLSRLMKKNNQL